MADSEAEEMVEGWSRRVSMSHRSEDRSTPSERETLWASDDRRSLRETVAVAVAASPEKGATVPSLSARARTLESES
eukprot:4797809-Prymnesium_polylepis.1